MVVSIDNRFVDTGDTKMSKTKMENFDINTSRTSTDSPFQPIQLLGDARNYTVQITGDLPDLRIESGNEPKEAPNKKDVDMVATDVAKDGQLTQKHAEAIVRAFDKDGLQGIADLINAINDELKAKNSKFQLKPGIARNRKTGETVGVIAVVDDKKNVSKSMITLQLEEKP